MELESLRGWLLLTPFMVATETSWNIWGPVLATGAITIIANAVVMSFILGKRWTQIDQLIQTVQELEDWRTTQMAPVITRVAILCNKFGIR